MPNIEENPTGSGDAWYLYWSRYVAAQAQGSRRDRKAVDARVEEYFRELCLQVRPTVGLELGAHQATFSVWLKESVPAARCLALEANPYVYDVHRERLAATGVDYRNLAVGPTNGTIELHIPRDLGKRKRRRTNRMASLNVHRKTKADEVVSVEASRLDDLVTLDPSDRVVAWIDVEGAAGQVLEGGREVLSRASAVYIEVENRTTWEGQWLDTDVARFLGELGLMPVIRDIQRPHQYNVVFVDPTLAADPEVARQAARVLAPRRPKRPEDSAAGA